MYMENRTNQYLYSTKMNKEKIRKIKKKPLKIPKKWIKLLKKKLIFTMEKVLTHKNLKIATLRSITT